MKENTQPCDNCGCLNVELVSGYYHCSGCQIMRQDIREHETDFDLKCEGIFNTKTTIKQETPKKQLVKVQLTTWKCYNYVIKGLVEELLVLGADVLLRSVVKKLWFKYLLEIEVINTEKPKLQAVNTKIDAEIIYGKIRKKKKRKYCISSNDRSSVSSNKLYSKKKRLLFSSQHEYSLSKSIDNSVLDETVESLKSQSQISSESSFPLKYNKYAKKELRRSQSESHLVKHSFDFENNLPCHRNSYREVSKKYQNSSHLLSINKIYSFLYLGLLITKSEIQLSDMLRFIREGHLSFNNFKHFFPEEMSDNFLTETCPKNSCLSSASLRESTYEMAKFLNVLHFIEVQDLASLIERFCTELNLPYTIEQRTLCTLVLTLPKMNVSEKSILIPNYEARALSLILFNVKLLFSMDGKTERYLSDHADTLNEINSDLKMFNFMEWLQYIDYRNHALNKHHFPTNFASDKQIEYCSSFVKFLISKNPDYEKEEIDKKKNVTGQECRRILQKLKDRQSPIEEESYFQASRNPSIDYIKSLLNNSYINGEEKKILSKNFRECSFKFISNPSKYINFLNEGREIEIKLGGANTNLYQHKIINMDNERTIKLKEDRKISVVHLGSTSKHTSDEKKTSYDLHDSSSGYIKKFEEYHEFSCRVKDIEKQFNFLKPCGAECKEKSFDFFLPHEKYWINTHFNLGLLSKEVFDEHLSTYPYNFQFILKELARMVEQSEQELLEEFSSTEIYLLYGEKCQTLKNDNINTVSRDGLMKKIVAKAIKHW